MKLPLTFVMLLACATLAFAGPPDITSAGQARFKSSLDTVVELHGTLSQGKQGYCLSGNVPALLVVFYVVPKMPAKGSYTYPEKWDKLLGKKVRVTGKLHFQHGFMPEIPLVAGLPDYYYMVIQESEIAALPSK